ncbi:unnamed protein product [Tuber aestivum]|uniref:Uncharacterized protein n=1 Tax=Tuber aestivum TaxID=59557 RepID=A0A292PW25_9PEZI|nr:unnamed protein product [Tuber aestivum]
MTSQSFPQPADLESFDAIDAYDWGSDREFQTGLQSILSSVPSPTAEQKEGLTLRAKCFFYSKMSGIRIDYNAYRARISGGKPNPTATTATIAPAVPETPQEFAQKEHSTLLDSTSEEPILDTTEPDVNSERFPLSDPDPNTPAASPGGTPDAPYPNSFAYIVELITTGQPIPGIKHIPSELNSAPPSEPVRAKRLKPWERASGDNPSPSAGVAVRGGGGGGGGGE